MTEISPAEQLFFAALELASPADRAVYLDRACGGDAALRDRVERMLAAHPKVGDFLEPPGPAATHPPEGTVAYAPAAGAGTVLAGRYTLTERIGAGGMGEVWAARQAHPVVRRVAVKLIRAGMDSAAVLARFDAERQALALMDHPNIAKVHDGGLTPDGRPFFVMELVKGTPITQYCDDNRLTPRQRLELFVPVCQAIQHAHQKGVIHRDIKPSNVLVARYDDRPVPKVIDFGVAKAAGPPLTAHALETGFGTVLGTPQYMSPEQATFDNPDVDTRADVYSLGVLLYELLAGSTPFSRTELARVGLLEMLRVVREEEPSRPSASVAAAAALPSLAASRATEPGRLTRLLRADLDWVVMKALEKDRARRYATANGFAADVQRYLAGEAVLAHPPTAGYRVRKFARRHRGPVVAAGVVLLALVVGVVGTTAGLVRAEWARQDADAAWRAEAERAEGERAAKQHALAEQTKAERAEAATLADYRAGTDEVVAHLIGSKPALGPAERTYLEKTLKRWQAFAVRAGDDERGRALRAEGHYRVAVLLEKLGRDDDARLEYEQARDMLADASPSVPTSRQDLARTHIGLGNLLRNRGQIEAARAEFTAARDMLRKLAENFPTEPEYHSDLALVCDNLGNVLTVLGLKDAARAEYQAARNLQQKLAEDFPTVPDFQLQLGRIRTNLGVLLEDLGQKDAARTEYEAARDLLRKLAEDFPTVPDFQSELARTRTNLGDVLQSSGQGAAARTEYEAARDLQRTLAENFPAVPRYRSDLAATHHNLGLLLARLGQGAAARTEYEAAREVQRKLAEKFPAVPGYRNDLALTRTNLGILLAGLGQGAAARTEFTAALELRKQLAASFPDVPSYQVALGNSFSTYGDMIRDNGKPADSIPWYDKAIATLTPVYKNEPRLIDAMLFLRDSHHGRADALDRMGRSADADADWNRAVALSPPPERPTFRAQRADSRVRGGRVAEGLAEVAELTKAGPWPAGQWYDFACSYAVASGKVPGEKQAHADRAMELLRQAVKGGYRDAAHMEKDADLDPLRDRDDFRALLADLAKTPPPKPAK